MPATALGLGAAALLAGTLFASAVAAGHRERLEMRIGAGLRDRRRLVRPWRAAAGRLEARALARGWSRGGGSYATVLLGAGVFGAAVGFRLAGPVGGAAGALGGPAGLEALLARRAEARHAGAEAQFREAVQALAAGIRAGLSVRLALAEAARDAEPPLEGVLARAVRGLQTGEPLGRALGDLASKLATGDAHLLVTVLEIHGRSGGDLPAHLDEVAALVGQRVEARRQVRALTAQGRASGVVLAVLPVAFVGLLSGTSGDGLGAFYRTPLGATLLTSGLVLEGLGFLWIRRIVRGPGT